MYQNIGLKRNNIEKFYTKPDIAKKMFKFSKRKFGHIRLEILIIEPSADNGSFINGIKELCDNYKFYDLYPEHSEIKKMDYYNFDYNGLNYRKIHVIGNPPFVRQSMYALRFIKKSCDTISFILPKSFRKESLKRSFNLRFHLLYEELPKNSFMINGDEYNVPCIFQIWKKKKVLIERRPMC